MSFQPPTTKQILLDAVTKTAGTHALDTIQPSEVIHPPDEDITPDTDFIPPCMTQTPVPIPLRAGPLAIMIGLDHECPRWTPGSVIRWTTWTQGFKTPEDAAHATNHLFLATQAWNTASIGITFTYVPLALDATFVLCHGGSNGSALASAFFPNANDLNYLLVYNAAFSLRGWKENMWKIFTHELGHVLGLRHEFAMDVGKERQKAVQLGPRNPLSVMEYSRKPPEIQESDVESTRAFYGLRDDEQGNPPRVGLTDVVDYTPM